MPYKCCVIGCKSVGTMDGRHFFRFPMLDSRSNSQLATSQARQNAWVNALKKPNFFASHYQHAKVCDLHFISGRSAPLFATINPDWVPTLSMGYVNETIISVDKGTNLEMESDFLQNEDTNDGIFVDEASSAQRTTFTQTYITYAGISPTETIPQWGKRDSRDAATQTTVTTFKTRGTQTARIVKKVEAQTPRTVKTVGTQTEDKHTGMSCEVILDLKQKIAFLEEMLSKHLVAMESFKDDDVKTCFFTGISKFETMEELFMKIKEYLPSEESLKLTAFQIFFIFLARIRLNLTFKYFAYQFGVSIQTISKHFYRCLHVMYSKLRTLIYWPDRDAIKKTMPLCFQVQFGKTIVVIIDCFEVFIEKPISLKAAAQCWSSYKHAYTIKYLIGITPQGTIQFISVGFGGRSSDKDITINSEFFENLLLGDVVMADRGFLIKEELKGRGIELSIPAFTKGKDQLHPIELEETRNVANVRIHVERVIGQLKQKYTILHQFKFPLHMITKKVCKPHIPVVDQIVTVCCALTNLCNPIVAKIGIDENDSQHFSF